MVGEPTSSLSLSQEGMRRFPEPAVASPFGRRPSPTAPASLSECELKEQDDVARTL